MDLWDARLWWPNLSFGPNLNFWPSVLKVFAVSLSGQGCLGHGSPGTWHPSPRDHLRCSLGTQVSVSLMDFAKKNIKISRDVAVARGLGTE